MKTVLAMLAIAGLLVGNETRAGDWEKINPGPKPNEELAHEQAQAYIAENMFDPDSAKFRNWTQFFKRSTRYSLMRGKPKGYPLWGLCVEVNGKNRMGGYVGFKTYIVNFKDGKIYNSIEDLFGECISGVKDATRH